MSSAGKGDANTRVDFKKYWSSPYWDNLEKRKKHIKKSDIRKIKDPYHDNIKDIGETEL